MLVVGLFWVLCWFSFCEMCVHGGCAAGAPWVRCGSAVSALWGRCGCPGGPLWMRACAVGVLWVRCGCASPIASDGLLATQLLVVCHRRRAYVNRRCSSTTLRPRARNSSNRSKSILPVHVLRSRSRSFRDRVPYIQFGISQERNLGLHTIIYEERDLGRNAI